jgi:chromosome segregation ATPase
MDPFNPETWKHQWEVFITAPYIILPLMVLSLVAGWWIGNKLASAGISGLNGTISNLNARIGVLEERLRFAAEREQDVQRARETLEKQVEELKAQIAAGAQKEELAPISARVDAALGEFRAANTALSAIIGIHQPQSVTLTTNVNRANKKTE